MRHTPYIVVPLHHRPDLIKQCCALLNSEWKRSETARIISLEKSCDSFPTCLILKNTDFLVGHCKISLVPSIDNACVIESVIINQNFRSQGLGSLLLKEVEKYVADRGITRVYLVTKGQENFYLKNGYLVCEPIDLFNFTDYNPDPVARAMILANARIDKKYNCPKAPLPPPMPVKTNKTPVQVVTNRTFMMKKLDAEII